MLHVVEQVGLLSIAPIGKLLAGPVDEKAQNSFQLRRIGRRGRGSFALLSSGSGASIIAFAGGLGRRLGRTGFAALFGRHRVLRRTKEATPTGTWWDGWRRGEERGRAMSST